MFQGFEEKKDAAAKKRFMASTGTSIVIFVAIGIVVTIVARNTVVKRARADQIDVTFRSTPEAATPELEKPPPPPPPQPKAAGAKRAGKRILTEPVDIPDEAPEEATPTGEGPPEADANEFGDVVADPGPVAPAPAPEPEPEPEPTAFPDLVDVPDDLIPARAVAGNTPPGYPEEQRKKGIEAQVVLKVAISESGEVTAVQVLRGDEPFASAAVAAVKSWRYTPAMLDGRPVATTRIVKMPFRIRT